MKSLKALLVTLLAAVLLLDCTPKTDYAPIAATTLPVWDFTARLCQDTPLTVTRLVTEQVSCLHDYSLNVRQVKAAEAAQVVVISGAGLEDFLDDLLLDVPTIDASQGISLLHSDETHEEEEHTHEEHSHHHEDDPHIWLSPENAMVMCRNICEGLSRQYPAYADTFRVNLEDLISQLTALQAYGEEQLSDLQCRELIPFHDGFSYFAQAFDLKILEAVEEESGSEASAKDLIHLTKLVREHNLPAIFTETSGSDSAAGIIARETGCKVYALDMAMSGDSYFAAMYHNIDTIREALG